jgi:hypothetical protein
MKKNKDNSINADAIGCEHKPNSPEIEVKENYKLSLVEEEPSKIITEADEVHHEDESIEEKASTEKNIDKKTQEEAPKFGRLDVKSTRSNTLRPRYSNSSKK